MKTDEFLIWKFVRFLILCISCHESAFRGTFPHLRGILWYGIGVKEGTASDIKGVGYYETDMQTKPYLSARAGGAGVDARGAHGAAAGRVGGAGDG